MPVPFHEVQFPINYASGTTGGPMYSTRVVQSDSGAEFRNQMWANGRVTYTIGYTADPTDMQTIVTFFRNRKGRQYGFRFRDWSDYKALQEPLVYSSTILRLIKTYTDAGSYSEVRRIVKPCNDGSFVLYNNGGPESCTVDWTTGLVTDFSTGGSSDVFTWSGNFDVPVRFDVDKLPFVQEHPGSRSISSIPIVELLINV